jgi:SUMO ligase MMS21 Smc5/6 complex component
MTIVAASKLGYLTKDYNSILENLTIGLDQLNECAQLLLTDMGETDPRLDAAFRQALKEQHALQKERDLIQELRQEVQLNPQAKDFVKRLKDLDTDLPDTEIEERTEYQEFKRKSTIEQEDEELAMVSQKISVHCPLTRLVMTLPYTSKTCHHSFSDAVIDYIQKGKGIAECPVAGCNHFLKLSDLYKDKTLARLIQKETLQQEEEEYDVVSDAESH